MNRVSQSALVVAIGVAAFLTWTFVSRRTADRPAHKPAPAYKDFAGIDKLTSVTILRFYASPGILTEGEKATLCYGVAKAKAVKLDPPVEALSPSLNRCIQVAPAADTTYRLTAEGEDGRTASESFVLQVKAAPQRLPKVLYFSSQKKGDVYSLCFGVENAERVSVEPPVIPEMEGAPRGCFYVAPRESTTYTVTATGRHGKTARRQITVPVP